jgi:hypothetical protein
MLISQTNNNTARTAQNDMLKTLDDLFDLLVDTSFLEPLPEPAACTASLSCSSTEEEEEEGYSEPTLKGRPRKPSSDAPLDLTMKRERNRLAAEKCRQKKQTLIQALQRECTELKSERDVLLAELDRLKKAMGNTPSQ